MEWMRPSVVIRSWLLFTLIFVLAGCDKTVAPKLDNPYDSESASYVAFPELTTRVVTQVSSTQAESGGSFGNDYGSEVSAKGVCWLEQGAATGLPVVGGNCTDEGGGFDAFVSVMTGLELGVSYVVRSYATNSDGTVYGGEREFVMGIVYLLEVNVQGSGTVIPGSRSYEEGSEAQVTAQASVGWRFVEWMGDVAEEGSTDNPITVLMDRDKSVTAVFDEELWSRDTTTEVVDVVTPATGMTWMDRNLGASRAATSRTDSEAYGDLYQWGRAADGHEKRNSSIRSTRSDSDQPGHGDFITTSNSPYDWRSPQNDNLWQGVDGLNNPCPVGYRLPTEAEWNAERGRWYSNSSSGAYGSSLKLPVAGYRYGGAGSLYDVGSTGVYWSSSVDGAHARFLDFASSTANMSSFYRATGASVRCLKD